MHINHILIMWSYKMIFYRLYTFYEANPIKNDNINHNKMFILVTVDTL